MTERTVPSGLNAAVAERAARFAFRKLEVAFEHMCTTSVGTPANRRATEEYARAYADYQAADARHNYIKCAQAGRRHLSLMMSFDIAHNNQSPTNDQRGNKR